MKITMTEKVYFGYFQGWAIVIDGVKWPRRPGHVYTAKSPMDALADCMRDRNDEKVPTHETKAF